MAWQFSFGYDPEVHYGAQRDLMLRDSKAKARLEEWAGASITNARQLTGGASRDTWLLDLVVDGHDAKWILRADRGGEIQPNALTRQAEFEVLALCHARGLLVPKPLKLCTDKSVLGVSFFVMQHLPGESVGSRVVRDENLRDARERLTTQMGEQLARLHAMPANLFTMLSKPNEAGSPAANAVVETTKQLHDLGEPHPVLEWAARWLLNHAPAAPRITIIHGDFRIGNLLVGADGLQGILDWEFTHLGDPAEDLGWPMVRSWRFSKPELRLGGVGTPDVFLRAYENVAGGTVDAERVRYWEILGNFRWAVGCISQADRHLSRQTRSVELASLGRRAAEMELELLNLIDAWERGASE